MNHLVKVMYWKNAILSSRVSQGRIQAGEGTAVKQKCTRKGLLSFNGTVPDGFFSFFLFFSTGTSDKEMKHRSSRREAVTVMCLVMFSSPFFAYTAGLSFTGRLRGLWILGILWILYMTFIQESLNLDSWWTEMLTEWKGFTLNPSERVGVSITLMPVFSRSLPHSHWFGTLGQHHLCSEAFAVNWEPDWGNCSPVMKYEIGCCVQANPSKSTIGNSGHLQSRHMPRMPLEKASVIYFAFCEDLRNIRSISCPNFLFPLCGFFFPQDDAESQKLFK